MSVRGRFAGFNRFAVLLAVGLLAACQGSTQRYTSAEARHENQLPWVNLAHEVRFAEMVDVMSSSEDERLAAFLRQVGASQTDALTIDVGSFTGKWADIRVRNVAKTLRNQVPGGRPLFSRVGLGELPDDTVRVTVGRYLVVSPRCPNWAKPSTRDPLNQAASNFGCATTVNLGLMVADPADLVRGRALGPADGAASALSIQRYRAGRVLEAIGQDTGGG